MAQRVGHALECLLDNLVALRLAVASGEQVQAAPLAALQGSRLRPASCAWSSLSRMLAMSTARGRLVFVDVIRERVHP